MTNDDKAILSALKASSQAKASNTNREKAKNLTDKAAVNLKDGPASAALGKLAEYLQTRDRMAEIGQPLMPPIAELLTLCEGGYVKSAEFAWEQLGDALNDLPLDEALARAPSVRVLDAVAKKHRALGARAIVLLEEQTTFADTSASLDWLVARAKPKELARLGPLLLAERRRRGHLAPPAELLTIALLRDKSGDALRAFLVSAADDSQRLGRLQAAIHENPKLLVHFVTTLPKTLSKPEAGRAIALLETWLPHFPLTPQSAREEVSAALAGLLGHLLRIRKRKESEERVLGSLKRNARDWLAAMETQTDTAGFWLIAEVMELLSKTKSDRGLTLYGAGLLASSLDKARAGYGAEALLEALALNLGMERINSAGERVSFDSALHEDAVGGLLAGDAATVSEPGWKLGEQIVRRAKVNPMSHA